MNRIAKHGAIWEIASGMVFALLISAGEVVADSEEPASLKVAREAYENAFFRAVEPIQRKYRQALAQHQRLFTRNGSLDQAREARDEIERAKLWIQSATFISRRGEYPVEIKPPVVK
jgi:hypothetical protein